MAELIQHVWSRPQPTQLAIMQAIIANMQAREEQVPTLTDEDKQDQLERMEKIVIEMEAGRI